MLVSLFNYFCLFAAGLTGLKFSVNRYDALKEHLKSSSQLPRVLGRASSSFIPAGDSPAPCAHVFSLVLQV